MISLAFPSQTIGAAEFLKTIVSKGVKNKSVRQWAEARIKSGTPDSDPVLSAANSAVNNCVDIEFYKNFAIDPARFHLCIDAYFESVGHSYRMAYSHNVNYIAAVIDPDFSVIPGGPEWDVSFRELYARRITGYFHGSPIVRGDIGLRAIYEGSGNFFADAVPLCGVRWWS